MVIPIELSNSYCAYCFYLCKLCYTYDSLNRVTERTIKKLSDDSVVSTETYSYDAAGNLTAAPDTTFSYDTNNRLTWYNGDAVSYDADGNMLCAVLDCSACTTFTYDSANRLISAANIYNPDSFCQGFLLQ